MIISDKNKYLFVELPRTGSTAISDELCKHYGGYPILKKHSTYSKFLKIATNEQKQYYVFSCIRNPIDRTFSLYTKLKNKNPEYYLNLESNRNKIISNYYFKKQLKWIRKNDSSFAEYIIKFHKWPYSDWSILSHANFNHVIRFENIQADFDKVLCDLSLKKIQDIPVKNKTYERKNQELIDIIEEYPDLLINTFGQFMKFWNYDINNFNLHEVTLMQKLNYNTINFLRTIYWKYIK